jgi:SMC interacting uncharacterized protein involved in chromosome segregation
MGRLTALTQEKEDATRKLQRMEISCDHFQKSLFEAQKDAETLQKAIVS